MELEEMQAVWSQMSDQIEKQKKLTDKMIIMMTQEKYRNKMNRIAYPEMIGGVVCYAIAIVILLNISKLDNWYSLLSGIISLIVLLILPILTLRSINRMRNLNIAGNSYKQTLIQYSRAKKQFHKLTTVGYYLGFVLMFTIMPVTSKIIKGRDFFTETKNPWFFVIAIPVAITFFILFSRWALKCYKNNINSAESLIKELK
ncbi:hypothetical protein [Aquimarina celericrescens]|uniref:DUF3278 domain-containing protein n=1 Tax=Aquimarina celericrescens TaxID=1964542 RepID=A0ABW5AS08_9FLAO|nr:hypothetical protein [Aquimarina celericrescens]